MKKIPDLSHINFTNEIDWTVPRWYINKDKTMIVLSHLGNDNTNSIFSGTCLPCAKYPNGYYTNTWNKSAFDVLGFDIEFVISNSDDCDSTPESENDE